MCALGGGVPDVLGLPLDAASGRLAEAGWSLRARDTAPPRGPLPGRRRVVRQRLGREGAVEVIAAAEVELRTDPGAGES